MCWYKIVRRHSTSISTIISKLSTMAPRESNPISTGCKVLCVLTILLVVAILIVLLVLLFTGNDPSALVRIGCGRVQGKYHSNVNAFSFRGIRYGKPPVGELRWKLPIAASEGEVCNGTVSEDEEADSGPEYDATHNPPQCFQMDLFSGQISGSEDCLFLNVFTPTLDPEEKLPVLVYIHGGYLQFGNSYTPGVCPDEKNAVKMGIVIVSIQYRLGPFGFLVTEVDEGKGNYGIHDQILALQWIQDHVHQFGGDPTKVTVSGSSSGGTSIFALLTSAKAKGLFQQALMISGSPVLNMTLEDARVQNKFFLQKSNCSNVACLRGLTPHAVLSHIYPEWDVLLDSEDLPQKGIFEPALLIVDGDLLELPPFDVWGQKRTDLFSDVPLVIGSTAQELDFGPAPGQAIKSWTNVDLYNYVAKYFDEFDPTFANHTLYDLYKSDKDPQYIFVSMASDIRMNCGNNILASKAAAAMSSDVYRYVITHLPSQEAHPFAQDFAALYAFHAWDIYAWFETYDHIMAGTSEADHKYFTLVQDNLLGFVKNGVPASEEWKPYPNVTALIDSVLILSGSDFNAGQCQFWNDNGFFSYGWIN